MVPRWSLIGGPLGITGGQCLISMHHVLLGTRSSLLKRGILVLCLKFVNRSVDGGFFFLRTGNVSLRSLLVCKIVSNSPKMSPHPQVFHPAPLHLEWAAR